MSRVLRLSALMSVMTVILIGGRGEILPRSFLPGNCTGFILPIQSGIRVHGQPDVASCVSLNIRGRGGESWIPQER